MTPTPDAKGAQPEQLVEQRVRLLMLSGEHRCAAEAALTALSECRKALEKAEQALEYHFRGQADWSIEKQIRLSNEALDGIQALAGSSTEGVAQPPSEAMPHNPLAGINFVDAFTPPSEASERVASQPGEQPKADSERSGNA